MGYRSVWMIGLISAIALGIGNGCGETESAARDAGANVENAGQTLRDTYEKDRKKGEGAYEAAGDAYDELLEVGENK
ncbi:hypothetical protein MK489_13275 [Myxococcota bacterium]|nr:hypothetical protein [Myxococcota bacterium]